MSKLPSFLRGIVWTVVWIVMIILYGLVQQAVLTIGAHKPIDNMIIVLPAFVVLYGVLTLVLLWLDAVASHDSVRQLLRTTFSGFDRHELKLIGLGMVLFLIFQLGFDWLVASKMMPLPDNQQALQREAALSPVTAYLSTAIGAPVVEELLFRGILMNLWHYSKSQKRRWIVIMIVAVIFGAAHSLSLIAWLMYSFAGVVLGYVYTATGKLRDSMLLHIFNNGILTFL